MRHAIRTYMVMKPLRQTTFARLSYAWTFSARPVAAVLIVALFASTGGISYAAEGTLPGDWLYGIKTNITEPVKGALALSSQAKSDWAASVAQTRVQEAATLAAEGRLDDETQDELENSFDAHVEVAATLIASETSTSPDTVIANAIGFEARLAESERVLTQVGEAKGVETGKLASAIRRAHEKVSAVRADAETRAWNARAPSGSAAAARMRDIAKHGLEDSQGLAVSASSALASSSAMEVSAQLTSAKDAIAHGEKELDDNATDNARATFTKALSATQKLGVFLKTSSAIHARTGLRIGEKKDKSEKTQKTTAPVQADEPSTPTTLSATADASSSAELIDAPAKKKHGEHGDDHDGDKKDEEDDEHSLLPVSVPENLLH